MARCKDCIHNGVCKIYSEFIKNHDCELFVSTADVVPKSEVEKIFEEMQSCLIQRHWNGLNIVSFEFDAVKYAELKKKYTKESEGKE